MYSSAMKYWPAHLAEVEDLDDLRVGELRGQLGLVDEHRDEGRVRGQVRQDPLDDQDLLEAVRRGDLGAEHLGHAADRQPLEQRVAAEDRGRVSACPSVAYECRRHRSVDRASEPLSPDAPAPAAAPCAAAAARPSRPPAPACDTRRGARGPGSPRSRPPRRASACPPRSSAAPRPRMLDAQQAGALGVALALAERRQRAEPRHRQRLAGDVAGRRSLLRRLQRPQEREQLRVTAVARVVARHAQRRQPRRQPPALRGAVAALLRERQLHLQVVAVGDPERRDLGRLDGGLDRKAQRVGDLDPVLRRARRRARPPPAGWRSGSWRRARLTKFSAATMRGSVGYYCLREKIVFQNIKFICDTDVPLADPATGRPA